MKRVYFYLALILLIVALAFWVRLAGLVPPR